MGQDGSHQMSDITQKEQLEIAANADCPIFLRKTYHMICSCDDDISCWTEDGMSFYVKKVDIFSSKVLPEYFKHNNFSSFVRQLNFYGFTKARNETLMNGAKARQSDWHFRHDNFQRDNPKLLVTIKRRLASQHGNGSSRDAKKGAMTVDVEKHSELTKDIQTLAEKLKSMENEMGKLTEMMNSIKVKNDVDAVSKGDEVLPCANSKKEATRLEGSSKRQKRILLNDAQLFSSNSNTMTSRQPQFTTTKNSPNCGRVSPFSLSVSKHEASIDLPDLGLAGTDDADLLLDDQKGVVGSRGHRIPSRRGSRTGTIDADVSMSTALAEVDQIYSSLESDMISSLSSSPQEQTSVTTQEPLPAIILDDGPNAQLNPGSTHSEKFRSGYGRNILDSAALLNLEKSLAALPSKERINFVQGIVNNISGLEDVLNQGLSIVEHYDSDDNAVIKSSLSRAEQVVESGIDTSLLTELESLLFRVGLKIQVGSSNESASCSSSSKRGKDKKDSSYVQIEA